MPTKIAHTSRPGKSDELFPENVATLNADRVDHHWRRSAGDIITTCPKCGGKLILHECEPWLICVGDLRCEAANLPFAEVIRAITRAERAARLDAPSALAQSGNQL